MVMSNRLPRALFSALINRNCIICKAPLKPLRAVAGSIQADGNLTFACASHRHNRRQWLLDWATFDASQQELRQCSRDAKQ
jgi:hypothetical protein